MGPTRCACSHPVDRLPLPVATLFQEIPSVVPVDIANSRIHLVDGVLRSAQRQLPIPLLRRDGSTSEAYLLRMRHGRQRWPLLRRERYPLRGRQAPRQERRKGEETGERSPKVDQSAQGG